MSAVDELLKEGAVYVIKNDTPTYVVLDPVQYEELRESAHEGFVAQATEALGEHRAGKSRPSSAQEIVREYGLTE